jgi:hypothetical protein
MPKTRLLFLLSKRFDPAKTLAKPRERTTLAKADAARCEAEHDQQSHP